MNEGAVPTVERGAIFEVQGGALAQAVARDQQAVGGLDGELDERRRRPCRDVGDRVGDVPDRVGVLAGEIAFDQLGKHRAALRLDVAGDERGQLVEVGRHVSRFVDQPQRRLVGHRLIDDAADPVEADDRHVDQAGVDVGRRREPHDLGAAGQPVGDVDLVADLEAVAVKLLQPGVRRRRLVRMRPHADAVVGVLHDEVDRAQDRHDRLRFDVQTRDHRALVLLLGERKLVDDVLHRQHAVEVVEHREAADDADLGHFLLAAQGGIDAGHARARIAGVVERLRRDVEMAPHPVEALAAPEEDLLGIPVIETLRVHHVVLVVGGVAFGRVEVYVRVPEALLQRLAVVDEVVNDVDLADHDDVGRRRKLQDLREIPSRRDEAQLPALLQQLLEQDGDGRIPAPGIAIDDREVGLDECHFGFQARLRVALADDDVFGVLGRPRVGRLELRARGNRLGDVGFGAGLARTRALESPLPRFGRSPVAQVAVLVHQELQRRFGDAEPVHEQPREARLHLLVAPHQRQSLRAGQAAVPDLAAGVVGHFRVAVLVELDLVVQVDVVVAVDVIVAIEGARAGGAAVAVPDHHCLVLRLRVPAHVVAEVDAGDAGRVKRTVVRVAVLPDVLFAQRVENAEQVVGLAAHQVVVLAIAPRHLDCMLVREHADLLEPLVGAPDDQRDAVAHRRLHRENRLPGDARPVDAAELAQAGARDRPHRERVHVLDEDVAVEADAQVGEVADAERRIEILVVGHQQRIEPEPLLDRVHDEVGIVSARDRNDAVVVAGAAAVRLHEFLEAPPARLPVEAVLLFVDAATRADAFIVKRQPERMVGRIEAAFAGLRGSGKRRHQRPSP